MEHDQCHNIAFLCVSERLTWYLSYEKVKEAFHDIPSDFRSRIAYVAHFDDAEIAKLKNALAKDTNAESAIDSFFCSALVREIGSDPCIENRRKLVFRKFNSFIAHGLYVQLKKTGGTGVDEWLREIERYYEYDDEFINFYTEGRYALNLQKSGLKVKMKPYNDGGPDLQISTGLLSFDIEVTRFVGDISLEKKMSLGEDETPRLIEMPDKSQDVWSKIEGKMKQLKKNKNGFILLRSDNIGIDWVEFEKNANDISRFDEKLCAVIFVDGWTRPKVISNLRARVPAEELTPILQRIIESITQPTHDWVVDLQRMCKNL